MINTMYIEIRQSMFKSMIEERDRYLTGSQTYADINNLIEREQEMIEMYHMCHNTNNNKL